MLLWSIYQFETRQSLKLTIIVIYYLGIVFFALCISISMCIPPVSHTQGSLVNAEVGPICGVEECNKCVPKLPFLLYLL